MRHLCASRQNSLMRGCTIMMTVMFSVLCHQPQCADSSVKTTSAGASLTSIVSSPITTIRRGPDGEALPTIRGAAKNA